MPPATAAPATVNAPLAEAALMARVAAGDTEAFATIYDRYAHPVLSYLVAQLGSVAEAQEVCQEAFISLWRHAGRFDPGRGALRGWLIGIARHQAIDRQRAETRRARAEMAAKAVAALEPPEDHVSRVGTDRAEAARMRQVLGDLPPEQREVLLLVHYGGLSQSEIAEATGLPLGTVKSRLRLGLRRMRLSVGVAEAPRVRPAGSRAAGRRRRPGPPLPRPAGAGRGAAA